MGKGSTPEPPDYTGAAEAESDASRQNIASQNYANRPDQFSPFGTTTWDSSSQIDPSTGKQVTGWTQNTSLTPELQSALDSQLRLQQLRSNSAEGMFGRVTDDLSQPIDWSGSEYSEFGAAPEVRDPGDPELFNQEVGDAIYNQFESRLDPQWEQTQNRAEIRMRNQGLQPGDQAFNDNQFNVDRAQNDAYQTAQNSAITGAGAEASRAYGDKLKYSGQMFGQDYDRSKYQTVLRQNQISEDLQRRGSSLNELNALVSGQQVGLPKFPGVPNSGVASTPDLLGAANSEYTGDVNAFNAQQQQQQQQQQAAASAAMLLLML